LEYFRSTVEHAGGGNYQTLINDALNYCFKMHNTVQGKPEPLGVLSLWPVGTPAAGLTYLAQVRNPAKTSLRAGGKKLR